MLSNLPSSLPVRQLPRFWTDFIPGRGKLALPHCKEHSLPQILPTRLTYAESFRCIGSACEDTCCQGWSVPVDQAAYEKFQQLPDGPLRSLIEASVIEASILSAPPGAVDEKAFKSASFAQIRMDSQNQCPLLTEERLCRIHASLGEGFLPRICATYPRVVHEIGGFEETALALSCPEAARLILLDPKLLAPVRLARNGLAAVRQARYAPAEAAVGGGLLSLLPWFRPIRQVVLALVADRAYPLWQRLFLLGVFCRRLDTIASGELPRSIPDFLADFEATVASRSLLTAMETLPRDCAAQLDVVLRLAGMLLHRSNVRPRFVECIQAFTAGIGNAPGATLESLTAHYAQAHDRYFEPFLRRQPHILENYLANTILRCRFPFRRKGAPAETPLSMARECALLTAQFALVRGLLIGVAGFHGEAFSAAHVVHAVQAASKHFEHHPEFSRLAYELLVESRMDGARGLAILLRDAEPEAASRVVRPASPEVRALGPREVKATSTNF
jgi:lysine-N-methylase